MDYRQSLIALVEAYCSATSRSEARVANLAGSDSRFFVRIREGRTCNVDTLHRIIGWFSDHWPVETPWPEGVARPAPNAVTVPPSEPAEAA